MRNKREIKSTIDLPPIPEKVYFTIGEVSELCEVKPHVLRYWEQEFAVLRPSKRRGSRRYYQAKDINIARRIRELLYDRGFTINGARLEITRKVSKAANVVVEKVAEIKKEAESSADKFVVNLISDLEGLLNKLKS